MLYAALTDRALLTISGSDAQSFLQGLISNDLNKLKEGAAMYAALLSPQGKFLHDFLIMRDGEALLLDINKERLSDLVKRLSLYKLRAAVEVTPKDQMQVVALWGGDLQPKGAIADPRLSQLGYRMYGEKDALLAECKKQGWRASDEHTYETMRIALGVPEGAKDMIIDKSFLLEMGFEELNGVDFTKGCYVGQEVTARSKFRGQVRKRLYQVTAASELPPSGSKILQDEAEVGELRSIMGAMGLAIVRTDAVEKADTGQLSLKAGGIVLTASLPSWAKPAEAA